MKDKKKCAQSEQFQKSNRTHRDKNDPPKTYIYMAWYNTSIKSGEGYASFIGI